MTPALELLPTFLIYMRASQYGIHRLFGRKRNGSTDQSASRFHRLNNFLRALIDQRVIVGFELNTDFLPCHDQAYV